MAWGMKLFRSLLAYHTSVSYGRWQEGECTVAGWVFSFFFFFLKPHFIVFTEQKNKTPHPDPLDSTYYTELNTKKKKKGKGKFILVCSKPQFVNIS